MSFLTGNVFCAGDTSIHGNLMGCSNASISGQLASGSFHCIGTNVTLGPVDMLNTANIVGMLCCQGGLVSHDDVTVRGNLLVSMGNVKANTLQIDNDSRVNGNLTCVGSATLSGGVHFANGNIAGGSSNVLRFYHHGISITTSLYAGGTMKSVTLTLSRIGSLVMLTMPPLTTMTAQDDYTVCTNDGIFSEQIESWAPPRSIYQTTKCAIDNVATLCVGELSPSGILIIRSLSFGDFPSNSEFACESLTWNWDISSR